MHEDTELAGVQGTAGISRRDMLRKSAVVGGAGALMWAAPSITKFGGAAFGEEHGDDGTPAVELSNFGAVVQCTEENGNGPTHYFKIKGDFNKETQQWEWDTGSGEKTNQNKEGFSLGGCEDYIQPEWGDAYKATGSDLGAGFEFDPDGETFRMTLGGATTAQYEDCVMLVFDGMAASIKQGQCCIGPAITEPHLLEWHGPFPNQPPCCHPDSLNPGDCS